MPEKRVLIVEDDEIIVRVLISMLRDNGFILQTPVNSGEQAIEQVAAERPDIVLMDIDLAGEMSGIKTAAELFNLFTIPVIFVTGHDEHTIFEKAIRSLPFGFLLKPVNPNLLVSSIHVALALCEKMLLTTEGKKAGLTQSMCVQISDSVHPVVLVDSELSIIWANQAAEELFHENGQAIFLRDIREGLSIINPSIQISPSFFRGADDSKKPVAIPFDGQMRQCIITARPIMNVFGIYSGSFISITTPQ